jgi:hypothetical protein
LRIILLCPKHQEHGAGWVSPSSNNFHGKIIADNKWDMSGCKTCHGGDYRGGNTGSACYDCHTRGPEGCRTCHGGPGHSYPPEGLNGDTSVTSIHVGAHVSPLVRRNSPQRLSALNATETLRISTLPITLVLTRIILRR